MRITGAVAVILGGLVAAVTGPLELSRGSWAAAYLVLVAGAAQVMMGSARRDWPRAGADAAGWRQFALWNLGNLAVIGGTVGDSTIIVFTGSALLVAALILALLATLRLPSPPPQVLLIAYRIVLLMLAVSIPVGMVLSALRNA